MLMNHYVMYICIRIEFQWWNNVKEGYRLESLQLVTNTIVNLFKPNVYCIKTKRYQKPLMHTGTEIHSHS